MIRTIPMAFIFTQIENSEEFEIFMFLTLSHPKIYLITVRPITLRFTLLLFGRLYRSRIRKRYFNKEPRNFVVCWTLALNKQS